MKRSVFVLMVVIFGLGCARVRVEAPKEPIKVDITMRLDIYQHIQKDIEAIEDIVSGTKKENQLQDKESFLDYFVHNCYAQESLSPEVEQAAIRRRDRVLELTSWQTKGVIGENHSGLVEIRNLSAANSTLEDLVKAENDDRMLIYRVLADKNNTTVDEIQKIYAQRLQQNAPEGTPIEVLSPSTGSYEWKVK